MKLQHEMPAIHQDHIRIITHRLFESFSAGWNEDLIIRAPDG
jgi:hypothetical protein